ncbi:hypothetical protein EV379_0652 [Microterricola gilva]|uniref:4-amino-4-deoxy-L-arabinose transferase-like glycosyltransferase n=1 Tax=Microterricola gilva TaxID=393267 RepID=A0A4Q8AIS2_9MICO|nr:hypothetical protein EV379_0652 [Microterricola gilva]
MRVPRLPGQRIAVGVGAALLTVGSAVAAAGGSPALLVLTVLLLGSWALARSFSWALSAASALVLLLGGHTILSRTLPLVGWDYGVAGIAALVLAGIGLLVLLIRTPANALAVPDRSQRLTAAAALTLPLLSGAMVFGAFLLGQPGYAWAMNNDMVWNTVAGRFILGDGGIVGTAHANPSPLMNALVASWIAPGRSAAPEMLRHDVARQAELWILLTLLAAALAGLIVARAVPARRRALRFAAGLLGSAIPLSWYATGSMIEFGFLNVMAAVSLLFVAWLTWKELPARPVMASAILLLTTTLMLAAWAPLAALPIGLAAVGVLTRWRLFIALRGRVAALWWCAALQLPAYVLIVTLPDLAKDGAALSADGATPLITANSVATAAMVLFTLAVVTAVGMGRRHEFAGVVVVLLTGGIALAYLLVQRMGVASLWGYYPVKLAWLLCIFVTVLLAAIILEWLGHAQARGLLGAAIVLACLVVTVSSLRAVPLPAGLGSALPLNKVALSEARGADTVRSDRLFRIADDGSKTIVARLGAPGEDAFVNGWLLQLQADSSADPIRDHSYTLDADDVGQLCAAARDWNGPVVIETADPALEDELLTACTDAEITVRMTEETPAV